MRVSLAGGECAMDLYFIDKIVERSGQPVNLCFQCQKCVSGCPISEFTDLNSAQIVRLLQYGLKGTLLNSRAIWLCSGCETCGTRCPNGISVGRIMDSLKEMALTEKRNGGTGSTALFHREFLNSVRAYGRVHEAGMLMRYKLKSGQLFSDIKLGLSMFRKGKLDLFPSGIRNKAQVRVIFENVEKRANFSGKDV